MSSDRDAVDPTDWESVARRTLATKLEGRARHASGAAWKVATAFQNDSLSDEEVLECRAAIEGLIHCLEDDVLQHSPAFDAYGGSIPIVRNMGDAADYLDLSMDAVNEVENGAAVELGTDEIREVCNGHSVHVETAAGVEIELTPKTLAKPSPEP